MNKRLGVRFTGVLAMSGLLIFSLAARKDPFEGKWKVTVDPEQGGKAFTDVLTFKGMQMTATDLVKKGWPAASYEEDVRQGGVAQFTCTLKNTAAGEEMKWQGQIMASEIKGTVVWTKKNKDEERYNFTGSKN